MKMAWVVLICFSVTTASPAQDPKENKGPAEIQIIKLSWSKQVPLPRGWDRPGYTASESAGSRHGDSRRRGADGHRTPVYVYSMKLKNAGSQTITGMAWDYRVLDAGNGKELSTHSFVSSQKIDPNKTANVQGTSPSSPSDVVSVAGLEKDQRSPFIERAVIKCVAYADGSRWQLSAGDEGDCESLKSHQIHKAER
jgi:hypothetical protein